MTNTAKRRLLLNLTANGDENVLVIERGEGPYIYDSAGRKYIDGLSSLYCAQLGYSYGDEFAGAAEKQLRQLPYSALWSGSAHPVAMELADRIAELAPDGIEYSFFTSGGAESVESAWKLARQYHVLGGQQQRTKVISRRESYHGLTIGALAFTEDSGLKDMFGAPAIDVLHVANTNRFRMTGMDDDATFSAHLLEELERAILAAGPDTIAMLIAEPVQNRGGCITPPAGYWPGLRRLADRYGFLLVADEVITGFGRLGEWFGGERYGARPDIVTVAKGLTAAYAPMGATLVGERVAQRLSEPGVVLNHGFTFSGHPLSAAIALRSIDIIERDGILDNVRRHIDHLAHRLASLTTLPIVGDVRGDGFFYALELVPGDDSSEFTPRQREELIGGLIPRRLRERGLIARVYNRERPVVQIAPPLISDRALLDRIVDIIGDTLTEASDRLVSADQG